MVTKLKVKLKSSVAGSEYGRLSTTNEPYGAKVSRRMPSIDAVSTGMSTHGNLKIKLNSKRSIRGSSKTNIEADRRFEKMF
jgi:hypothetical protein